MNRTRRLSEVRRNRWRKSIYYQVRAFKQGAPKDLTVDHLTPLHQLRGDFLERMGFPRDKRVGRILFERLKSDWQAYHEQHAVLELVPPGVNEARNLAMLAEMKKRGGV